jgi:hypothetical protein
MDVPKSDSTREAVTPPFGLEFVGELLCEEAYFQPYAAKGTNPASDNVRVKYELYAEDTGTIKVSKSFRLPAPGFPPPPHAGARGQLAAGTFPSLLSKDARMKSLVRARFGAIDLYEKSVQIQLLSIEAL